MTDRLLTARELAEYLGLRPATVLDKWERGELPGFKFGRAVRFDLEEVRDAGRQGATPKGTPRQHPTRVRIIGPCVIPARSFPLCHDSRAPGPAPESSCPGALRKRRSNA